MEHWAQDFKFTVDKPDTTKVMPTGGWSTVVPPVSPWAMQQQVRPKYADDEQLKKLFGVEWARCEKPFEAACKVFETDTSAALWIASNWLTDPVVIAAKDIYSKEVNKKKYLLDRDEFAAMLLERSEKMEDEEANKVLKLYADVRGFLNKDSNTINNFNNNEGLKVIFVKAAPVEIPTIAPVSNEKSVISNDLPSPLKIKLVSNG